MDLLTELLLHLPMCFMSCLIMHIMERRFKWFRRFIDFFGGDEPHCH